MRILALPLLLSFLTAQAPPTEAADPLETLARRVEQAHQPNGPVPPVDAFHGTLELHLLDKKANQGGQVDLDVRFLQWQQPGRARPTPLIRYELKDAGTPIVRGRDEFGPWQMSRGAPRDLGGPDFATDLEAFGRHANLARQLLRFLYPAAVLRALQQPSAVTAENLQIARGEVVPCETIEGDLPAFPLLQQGGDDAPVRLKIYVTKADGRLLAADATPLVDGKPDAARGERILLIDLHERDGLLVPRELKHLFREDNGQWSLKSRAVMTTLSLRPELRAEDFDRTR